jgi:adenine deaminase
MYGKANPKDDNGSPPMINTFCRKPLWECNSTLVRVAQGLAPADLVVRDARLVSVTTREVLEHADIAVAEGRIAYLGLDGHTAEHCMGPDTRVIDAAGSYVAPGFLDGHMHVESAMVGVSGYARAAIPHGTVGVYMDPHEMANVCGLDGVRTMMEEAAESPIKAMLTTPSCVPAVPGFEDTGSAVDADDVDATMSWPETVGLGEMMNFPGILAADADALAEVDATLRTDKCVTGHYSTSETDRGLNAYVAAGISACHESVRPEDVLAKLRLGMYAQLREGSAWHNLAALAPAITTHDVDTRLCCLVSDDNHPNTIVSEGHLDRILRMAVRLGIDPVTAIQMVTINTASCFRQARDLGSVTPGKCADLVFLDDLHDFGVTRVIIDGEVVAEDGRPLFPEARFAWPDAILHTMHVGERIAAETFRIPAPVGDGVVPVRAMGCAGGSTVTRELHAHAPARGGELLADAENDLLKVFVFERHHATGAHAAGFAKGFGIHGALAQTVAHDAHNLIVMGDNDDDMAIAANALVSCGGGEVAVRDGRVLALVELPIAGLMSPKPVEEVARDVADMERAWAEMGCTMPSPFMTMASMSLACIPELRLTDKGYVDCTAFRFVPLVMGSEA